MPHVRPGAETAISIGRRGDKGTEQGTKDTRSKENSMTETGQ